MQIPGVRGKLSSPLNERSMQISSGQIRTDLSLGQEQQACPLFVPQLSAIKHDVPWSFAYGTFTPSVRTVSHQHLHLHSVAPAKPRPSLKSNQIQFTLISLYRNLVSIQSCLLIHQIINHCINISCVFKKEGRVRVSVLFPVWPSAICRNRWVHGVNNFYWCSRNRKMPFRTHH